ncbi:BirA family transcriptional regulator, biotin operon repressor / biotin-[acetyl-CoA-carboxylase] ligase [Solimonas aquatica]|uniref:Bifunctional ligase/repressor BirA n=1 Tax=Solimonas aquatica TaxID=489703 RepID=A0A1H9JP56_9GAMM|nr:bifunctional biotin--[acetyl-CoA-carboxylase] ligase/biotin operon repressor BirA [Solimonas aquatica]SEQ88632.1 BirA family transcriptional regulator, biotin operon repressor / biotin-[acetyl-CoA-carboxylase] ligase [Solimonas aquatica]
MAATLSQQEQLELLDALADGQWHSGEALAARFGVSRAALSKRVERLREWQLEVESRQGLGYRLSAPIERLDAQRLQAAVPQLPLQVLPIVESTNTLLLACGAEQDPQALLAEFQSGGRGRRGRQWISPFGANLYLSLSWSWPSWPRQLTALSLAVGVACAQALRRCGLSTLQLKWPNDLLVAGRKLGGVLIEHRGEAGGSCRVVIGIGLNLRMAATQGEAVSQPWINLDEALRLENQPPAARNEVAAALLQSLHGLLDGYAEQGFAAVAAQWSALDACRDRPVLIVQHDHTQSAIARGVDSDGALLVDIENRRERLLSGEVSLRPA